MSKRRRRSAGTPRGLEPGVGATSLGPADPVSQHVAVKRFFLALFLFALALAFWLIQPFLHPLIFAALLAILLTPLQTYSLEKGWMRENVSALVLTVLTGLIILLPFLFFFGSLAEQAVTSSQAIVDWIRDGGYNDLLHHPYVGSATAYLEGKLAAFGLPGFAELNLKEQIISSLRSLGDAALSAGGGIVGNLVAILANFAIMLFVMFYLIRDGRVLARAIKDLSPLPETQEERIFDHIRRVTRAVFLGNFLTALLQGLAGGLAMAVVGIPPVFWGALLGFSSLIPVVGTALVWIPATVFLIIKGSYGYAIFFGLWSALVVGSIDNFLRPFLMRGAPGFSPFYVFLAILGGVQLFGLPGLIYGPLIIAFATVMLFIYRDEFRPSDDEIEAPSCALNREPATGLPLEATQRAEETDGDERT